MKDKKPIYIEDDVLNKIEKDSFGHSHIADSIVDSILTTNPPFTIGIFGGWGTGKSSLLELIKKKLENHKGDICMASIDAWRYSSADNLRRSFLVHVAAELSYGSDEKLNRDLFTTQQETILLSSGVLDFNKNNWKDIFLGGIKKIVWILYVFLGIAIVFFLLLLALFVFLAISKEGVGKFAVNFNLQSLIMTYINLLFIPLLLVLGNDLRINIFQRPVSVTHEKINADELFSRCFKNVIKTSTEGIFPKKKVVIFIDNLDRLSENKIVEALESLKTYLIDEKCIFLVACDDNVVREVINKQQTNYQVNAINGKAGEHYLDKFFQQTFRLPDYDFQNLRDCAKQNLETVRIYDELLVKGIDVRSLIAIILPSDVNSPRKVKRLLNEFIALYEIVKRREGPTKSKLVPGLITNNLEFLGKFSTIRAEYPKFYKALCDDPNLIQDILDDLSKQDSESVNLYDKWTKKLFGENATTKPDKEMESFFSYLLKTQSIVTDDIFPFMWLSQDSYSLGLKGNHYRIISTLLSDGNVEKFKSLLVGEEEIEYRILLIKVSSRIVESRFAGVEQQNGLKVLAQLLPDFDQTIQFEIANLIARLMPTCPIHTFSTVQIFNVLRWAQWGGIDSQRESFINQIIIRLEDKTLRKTTFEAILMNGDIVERNKATEKIQYWQNCILKIDEDVFNSNTPQEENSEATETVDHEFAEWLISQIDIHINNDLIIEKYFSSILVEYVFRRLFREIDLNKSGTITLNEYTPKLKIFLENISNHIEKGFHNEFFFNGILEWLERADNISEIQFCREKADHLISYVDKDLLQKFQQNLFAGIINLLYEDNQDINQEVIKLFLDSLETIKLIERNKDNNSITEVSEISVKIERLLQFDLLRQPLLSFIEIFTQEFGSDKSEVYIAGVILAISKSSKNNKFEMELLDMLIRIDESLSHNHRASIVEKIDQLLKTNEITQIEEARGFVDKVVIISDYKKILNSFANNWLANFSPDSSPLLMNKLSIFNKLVSCGILEADFVVEKIIPYFPYQGDQEKLHAVITGISEIKNHITEVCGTKVFEAIISEINSFGLCIEEACELIASWIIGANDNARNGFNATVSQLFTSIPHKCMQILLPAWKGLSNQQIREHLIRFFCITNIEEQDKRAISVNEALQIINEEERTDIIISIWNDLIAQNGSAEDFMMIALQYLPLPEILKIRQNAINMVRESGASERYEENLRLLAATIRQDMRSISPIVDLFENLFGRGESDIKLAIKYVTPCLKPLIYKQYKGRIAQAMGKASNRVESQDLKNEIEAKTHELGLRWWDANYWK